MRRSALVLGIGLSLSGLAGASTWVVDQGGGGDFTTIQAAIDYATTGDEIIVNAGTYVENVSFVGKDLWVHSAAGAAATSIDGTHGPLGEASCVSFTQGETSAAILEGFTLTGGRGTLHRDLQMGGGVLCLHTAPTLRNLLFVNNYAQGGAGVYLGGSAATITDCEFRHNFAQSLGAGLASSSEGCNPTVLRCLFQENTAGWGGGAVHFDPAGGVFQECVFRGNEAETGGAISLGGYGPGPEFLDCTFEANRAFDGIGGAVRLHESSAQFQRCLFYNNSATASGGALLAIDGSSPFVRNCTFCGNAAASGGHVYCQDNPQIQNSILVMAASGGGLVVQNAQNFSWCNDVWGNTGGDYVGCPNPTGTNGNISTDPMFCDPDALDFTIWNISPCAPQGNPECGLIGALGVGCYTSTATEAVSWGGLKARFR